MEVILMMGGTWRRVKSAKGFKLDVRVLDQAKVSTVDSHTRRINIGLDGGQLAHGGLRLEGGSMIVAATDYGAFIGVGTTAVMTTTSKTSRKGGIRTRATELTTILYVTTKGIYAREAIFTVIREPKSDSTLKKGADMGNGRGWERAEKETTKR
jgi:hypothetical protein